MAQCAFCESTADSGEHIWSDWFNKILPKTRGYQFLQETGQGLRRYKARVLNRKLPVVCAKCNNGWMSDMENKHAKPAMEKLVLSDKGAVLSPQQLTSIALFAFKSAVIADHTPLQSLDRSPFFTMQQRAAFRDSFRIPGNVQMWLGAFKEEGHGIFRAIYYPCPPESNPGFEVYAATFGAGFLIFQVVACRWTKNGPFGYVPRVKQGRWWEKFTVPFWPNDGRSVFWPPDKQFTLRTASEFSRRWQKTLVPVEWLKTI